MHTAAYEWVKARAPLDAKEILDVCGRNINGSVKDLFPQAERHLVLDLRAEPDVDIVADATSWEPTQQFDLVLCLNSFEHIEAWRNVFNTCYLACKKGGHVVLTMGGPGCGPHSAHGGSLQEGEYYHNIEPLELIDHSLSLSWISTRVEEDHNHGDLYFIGQKQ